MHTGVYAPYAYEHSSLSLSGAVMGDARTCMCVCVPPLSRGERATVPSRVRVRVSLPVLFFTSLIARLR